MEDIQEKKKQYKELCDRKRKEENEKLKKKAKEARRKGLGDHQ